MIKPPEQPSNSFRVTLTLADSRRLDGVLLEELRKQTQVPELKTISRTAFKALFKARRIQLKGQSAVPSSTLASGTSYVDILGFEAAAV